MCPVEDMLHNKPSRERPGEMQTLIVKCLESPHPAQGRAPSSCWMKIYGRVPALHSMSMGRHLRPVGLSFRCFPGRRGDRQALRKPPPLSLFFSTLDKANLSPNVSIPCINMIPTPPSAKNPAACSESSSHPRGGVDQQAQSAHIPTDEDSLGLPGSRTF